MNTQGTRSDHSIDTRLTEIAMLRTKAPSTLDPHPVAVVSRALGSPLVVEGPPSIGKTSVCVAAAAMRRRPALIVDLARCGRELLALARQEANRFDAVMVIRGAAWSAIDSAVRVSALALANAGIAILTARGPELGDALRSARRVRVGLPAVSVRQRIWSAQLPTEIARLVTFDLCVRYPLPPGELVRVATIACARAARECREVTVEDLETAARAREPS